MVKRCIGVFVGNIIYILECYALGGRSHLQQGVCHTVALPFTLKSILVQKKNYGNSNISPCKKYNLQKNPLEETKIFQDITTLL
jgi:hypothetical protein